MDAMESGYKMLGVSGSNQYLNPDYIQPISTTLDAKNSPLALLAQTCSSIGKDSVSSSSSKLGLSHSSSDRKDGGHKQSNKDGVRIKSSDSPGVAKGNSGGGGGGGSLNIRCESRGTVNKHCGSNDRLNGKDCSSRSSEGGEDYSPRSRGGGSHSITRSNGKTDSSTPSGVGYLGCRNDYLSSSKNASTTASNSVTSGSISLAAKNKYGDTGALYGDSNGYPSDAATIHKLASLSSSALQSLRYQQEALQAASLGFPPFLFGHPLASIDPLLYSAALSSQQKQLQQQQQSSSNQSPCIGYTRLNGSTLVPVCKDPFCQTGSMSSLHAAHQLGSTPTGCGGQFGSLTGAGDISGETESSEKSNPLGLAQSASSLLSAGQFPSLFPFQMLSAAHLGAAAGLGQQLQAPYACSWLQPGSDFCGKRFTTYEELLDHLRTHASSGDPAAAAAAAASAFPLMFGLSPASAGLLGSGSTGGHHPYSLPGRSSLSPNSLLQQAASLYPRSLSPGSILQAQSISSRYHPYRSPFASLLPSTPSSAGTSGGVLGSMLGPYGYSLPYTLYGQRIGAAAAGP